MGNSTGLSTLVKVLRKASKFVFSCGVRCNGTISGERLFLRASPPRS
jgi:hypothetical protein